MRLDLPRAERAAEALALRAQGLTHQQIADRMGISRTYAQELCSDPEGEKVRARKASYRGTCEGCGGPTDGSNGRAKAPKLCLKCSDAARAAVCGTYSKYSGGCSCDECREANRLYHRSLRDRVGPPPSHGQSGYVNYGCRCSICTRANTEATYGYRVRFDRNRRVAA